MKYLLLLLFQTIIVSAQAQNKNDSTAIIQLLKMDYATMGNFDIQAHLANCTKDYLLIENGEVWDLKKETEWYRANAHKLITRTDSFTIRTIKVFNNLAYAVYHLISNITENNVLKIKT